MQTQEFLEGFVSSEQAEAATKRLLELPRQEFAALIPLSNLNQPGRKEFSVQYLSENWAELASLLADPQGFLRSKGQLWDDKKLGLVDWSLQSDLTCIISPVPADGSGAAGPAQVMNSALSQRNLIELSSFLDVDHARLKEAAMADDFDAVTRVSRERGAFLVEFAVGTRILYIWYWSPLEPVTTDPFTGSITEALVVFTTNGPKVGTLHFDLFGPPSGAAAPTKPDDAARADFVVRCLENRTFLFNLLKGKTTKCDSILEPKLSEAPNPILKQVTGAFFDPAGVYPGPRIVIDRIPQKSEPVPPSSGQPAVLSGGGPPQCFTCCNAVAMEDGPDIIVCDLLLKEYCPEPPPGP